MEGLHREFARRKLRCVFIKNSRFLLLYRQMCSRKTHFPSTFVYEKTHACIIKYCLCLRKLYIHACDLRQCLRMTGFSFVCTNTMKTQRFSTNKNRDRRLEIVNSRAIERKFRPSKNIVRIPFRALLKSAVSIYKRMYFSFCVPEHRHALQDSRSLAASISQRPLASHERMLQQICDEIADAIHLVKLYN